MKADTIYTVPLLPLRGMHVYPTMVLHLDVGRDRSIEALEKAMMNDQLVFLSAQKDPDLDDPSGDDVYEVGTLTKVKQMLKLPNGTIRVLVEGLDRAKLISVVDQGAFYEAVVEVHKEDVTKDTETEALMRMLLKQFEQYVKLSKKGSAETISSVADIEEPGRLADIATSHMSLKLK